MFIFSQESNGAFLFKYGIQLTILCSSSELYIVDILIAFHFQAFFCVTLTNKQMPPMCSRECDSHLYNYMTSVCIFVCCWPWSIKAGHTQMASSPRQITSADLFFFFHFSCPKNPSLYHLNFYNLYKIDYIFPCMCVL